MDAATPGTSIMKHNIGATKNYKPFGRNMTHVTAVQTVPHLRRISGTEPRRGLV